MVNRWALVAAAVGAIIVFTVYIGEVTMSFDAQELYNTEQCLVDCKLIYRIRPHSNHTVMLPQLYTVQLKRELEALPLEDSGLDILVNESYIATLYNTTCQPYNVTVPANVTNGTAAYNQTVPNCTTVSYQQELYRDVWKPWTPGGFRWVDDEWFYFRAWARKQPKLGPNNIEINVNVFGQRLAFSWWNSNWLNYKNVTIHADSITHTNDYHEFNISSVTLSTNNATIEPRAVSDTGIEQDFIIIDDAGQALGDGDEWFIAGVNYTVNENTDRDITWYYNNPAATIPAYMDEQIGVPNFAGMYSLPEVYGWTHTETGGEWKNVTLPEASNRWHGNFTAGLSADTYRITDSALLNHTWLIRFNTSNTDASDQALRVGTGSGAATDYYSLVQVYSGLWYLYHDSEIYGGCELNKIQTYRITYNESTRNTTVYVYNQSDGSAVKVGSLTLDFEYSYDNFYLGDVQAAGDTRPRSWYDFIALDASNSYHPLEFTLGAEQSAPPVDTCTPGATEWVMKCSDNCTKSSTDVIDVAGAWTIYGTGGFFLCDGCTLAVDSFVMNATNCEVLFNGTFKYTVGG